MPYSAKTVNLARMLVRSIAAEVKSEHGFSSIAVSIYDTAWLAMIRKGSKWLFPASFTYLLKHQGLDGGWDPLNQSTRAVQYPDYLWIPDCIVHSLAGLLALCRHSRFAASAGEEESTTDILPRITRAKSFLNNKLTLLTLDGITHSWFEMIVPVLLRLLEQEGLHFTFPAKKDLLQLYEKASSADMTWIYDNGPCKIPLFCLEAFLWKVDFSRLSHMVTFTAGVTASPASTAAYLIHSGVWSRDGEAYLRHVVSTRGDGSVGGIFPLAIFESCWALTALLDNGFAPEDIGAEEVDRIIQVIRESLTDGVTGATHAFFPDADDTARALMILNSIGCITSPAGMIQRFEGDDCFLTFDDTLPNRVASVSVNGNVLGALLRSPEPDIFAAQIEKVARFLCAQWRQQETLHDHWNISQYYCIMHIAHSLTHLLKIHNRGQLPSLSADLMTCGIIPCTLQQLLEHLLTRQHSDGTWGELHCCEEVAYAIVALAHIGSYSPVVGERRNEVDRSIARGKQYILENWTHNNPSPDRLWTGKVLHGFAYITEAYVLAALRVNRVNLTAANEAMDPHGDNGV
ncbi:hypothetical protein BDW72DRAFT_209005 [Aspergillus terricola var. indicus]